MLSTTAFLAAAMQCAASIHPSTALDVARAESSFNPYAIAEIIPKATGTLENNNVISHLPATRERAEHIIRRLAAQGRRYSVGLMQITSTNFRHYGVTATDLLDPCTNLSVFERILSDCYQRGGTLKRALSCYYSGNFRTGLQPEAAFSGTSYLQRMGYVSASPRYAVPGTREDKSTTLTPLEAIPADKPSPPRVIWPGTVVRASPQNSVRGKSPSHRPPRRQYVAASISHPVRKKNNDTFSQAKDRCQSCFRRCAHGFSTTPAFADGFTRANTVMEKVSTGLHGLAAITITVAVIWWVTRPSGKAKACPSAPTSSLAGS
jgi:type IV secretion system protein VirB1